MATSNIQRDLANKNALRAPPGTGMSVIPPVETMRPANAPKPAIPLPAAPGIGLSTIPAAAKPVVAAPPVAAAKPGALRSLVPGPAALATGAIVGATKSLGDSETGYRDNFAAGVDTGKDGYFDRLAGTISNFTGVDKGTVDTSVKDAARVASNVGSATTLGVAPRIGSGVSALASGGSFSEGFMNTPEDRFNAIRTAGAQPQARGVNDALKGSFGPSALRNAPPATTSAAGTVTQVVPGSYQSNRLAELGVPVSDQNKAPVTDAALTGAITDAKGNPMGRDGSGVGGGLLTRQTSAPGVTNLGSYGGDSNIYATASTPGGRLNQFYGVGAKSQGASSAPESLQDQALRAMISESKDPGTGTQSTITGGGEYVPKTQAINAQFDKLIANNKSTYSGAGLGNGARGQLEIEKARSAALAADQNNVLQSREQSLRASSNSASLGQDAEQKRLDRSQRLMEMVAANQRVVDTAAAAGSAAAAKAQGVSEAAAGKAQLEGNKNYNNIVKGLFTDSEKPEAAQEKFNSFVANTPLQEALGMDETAFSSLKPDEMRSAVARLQTMMEMQDAAREVGAVNETGMTFLDGDKRESTYMDPLTGKMGLGDYARQVYNPFVDDNVQPLSNGKVVPMDRYVGTDDRAGDREKQRLFMLRNPPPKK